MIKLQDYSGFKAEDFRFDQISDGWARLAMRLSMPLLVISCLLSSNILGLPLLTPLGGLCLSFSLMILGFLAAFACSRSVLFAGGQKVPYISYSLLAVLATYLGYLALFYHMPHFMFVEVQVLQLVRASALIMLALIFQLCFAVNPQKRTSMTLLSAMVSLLVLTYDILWVSYEFGQPFIGWFWEKAKDLFGEALF
ncbi:MAG: hypothetical protein ACFFB3_11350 [Candidatus Hodarchaeota archaeon]